MFTAFYGLTREHVKEKNLIFPSRSVVFITLLFSINCSPRFFPDNMLVNNDILEGVHTAYLPGPYSLPPSSHTAYLPGKKVFHRQFEQNHTDKLPGSAIVSIQRNSQGTQFRHTV